MSKNMQGKLRLTLWISLLVSLIVSPVFASDDEKLELNVQQQYRIYAPESIVRSAVGDPNLLSVNVISSRELLITAKKNGTTSLMVWKRGYTNPLRYQVNITPALPADAGKVHAQALNGGLVISGEVDSLRDHDRLVTAAGKDVVDNTYFQGAIQVQTDIKIVEISRSQLKSAGALLGKNSSSLTAVSGPPGSIGGVEGIGGAFNVFSNSGFLPSADAYSIIIGRAQKSLLGVISALHNNGYAYTLAEPSLVSLSGQTATFLAGGEFPFPVSNRDGDLQVEFKEFGVRLNLTPTVLDDNNIMLKVAPEVSELDFTTGVRSGGVNVPSLRVRRTDTSVQLGSGESFIISGLVSTNTSTNADKLPGLGDIPILGAFFRSTRYDRNDKELIMIVTPHLVRPIAANTRLPELPGEVYRQHNPGFGSMLFGRPVPKDKQGQWTIPDIGFSN